MYTTYSTYGDGLLSRVLLLLHGFDNAVNRRIKKDCDV